MLHYQGSLLYEVTLGHQTIQLSQDEIQQLVNEVGEHIENEYESPFTMPTSDKLQEEVDLLEKKLEQADDEINELEEQLSECE